MSESLSHTRAAKSIARKYGTEYNRGSGPDVETYRVAVEVETEHTVKDATMQLQGRQKAVYIAGSNKKAVETALEVAEGTTVGVMDKDGNILKQSTRSR